MDIEFSYVGPFINFKLSLPDKGLVALIGNSGSGKSSLLAGINWILTGEPRNITHVNATNKNKVYGKLKYRQLKINRYKKPDRLEIQDGDLFLDNKDTAQSYITKKFGQNNVIEASSYLSQKSFHSLLQLSNSDKLSLITNLVWTETSPEDYIDRVDKHLKTLVDKLPSLTAEVDYTRKQLSEEKDNYNWYEFEPENDYQDMIDKNEKLLAQWKKQQTKYHQIVGKLSTITKQINLIVDITNVDNKQIEELKNKLKKYQRQQSLTGNWQKSIALQEKLTSIENYNIDVEKFQLKKIIRQEVEYQQQKNLADRLKIEYDEKAINNTITIAKNDEKIYSNQQTIDKIK